VVTAGIPGQRTGSRRSVAADRASAAARDFNAGGRAPRADLEFAAASRGHPGEHDSFDVEPEPMRLQLDGAGRDLAVAKPTCLVVCRGEPPLADGGGDSGCRVGCSGPASIGLCRRWRLARLLGRCWVGQARRPPVRL